MKDEELVTELLLEIKKQLNSHKSDLTKADTLVKEILSLLSTGRQAVEENKRLKEQNSKLIEACKSALLYLPANDGRLTGDPDGYAQLLICDELKEAIKTWLERINNYENSNN